MSVVYERFTNYPKIIPMMVDVGFVRRVGLTSSVPGNIFGNRLKCIKASLHRFHHIIFDSKSDGQLTVSY